MAGAKANGLLRRKRRDIAPKLRHFHVKQFHKAKSFGALMWNIVAFVAFESEARHATGGYWLYWPAANPARP